MDTSRLAYSPNRSCTWDTPSTSQAITLTGEQLATKIAAAIGRPIEYSRFPEEFLNQSDLMRKLVAFVASKPVLGRADLVQLRQLHPALLDFDAWLERSGKPLLAAAAG